MSTARFQSLRGYPDYSAAEQAIRADEFLRLIKLRRTVRDFSARPVPRHVIEQCLRAAATAPSGANLQPWHFAVVSELATKMRIREAAELEEQEFYQQRAPQAWLEALSPLGTDHHKPFLEIAPYLIVIFRQTHSHRDDGQTVKHYYSAESVGIATGILITALHNCGLATLTHTPSPMNFLNEILGRPNSERPFLILVTGYPAPDAKVPVLKKKQLPDYVTFH